MYQIAINFCNFETRTIQILFRAHTSQKKSVYILYFNTKVETEKTVS